MVFCKQAKFLPTLFRYSLQHKGFFFTRLLSFKSYCIWKLPLFNNQTRFSTSVAPSTDGCMLTEEFKTLCAKVQLLRQLQKTFYSPDLWISRENSEPYGYFQPMEKNEGVLALAGGSTEHKLSQETPGAGRYRYNIQQYMLTVLV